MAAETSLHDKIKKMAGAEDSVSFKLFLNYLCAPGKSYTASSR